MVKLQGTKIYLMPITNEDTELIIQWRNKPSVQNNFIFRELFTRDMHEKWMKEKIETGRVIQFIIIETEKNRKVGSVYLRDIDHHNHSAEYGIFIGEDNARGLGYGSEACRLITDYGFKELGLHRIFLRVFKNNQQAIHSYLKAGFVEEGVAKDMIWADGRYNDMVFMAKIASDR